MRPILPYKGPPGYDDEGSTEASTTDEGLQLSKLIDWTVALVSIATERNLIGKAFGQINMWLGSLNQTFGPYGDCACFMELEVKKTQAARDSRLQIATWASAGIKKKNFHDWDTSFPMPAITVDGHKWELCIFWESNKDVVSQLRTQFDFDNSNGWLCCTALDDNGPP